MNSDNCFVPKAIFMYSATPSLKRDSKCILPASHILNKLSTSKCSARKLVKLIFEGSRSAKKNNILKGGSSGKINQDLSKVGNKPIDEGLKQRWSETDDSHDDLSCSLTHCYKDQFSFTTEIQKQFLTSFKLLYPSLQNDLPSSHKSCIVQEEHMNNSACGSTSLFVRNFNDAVSYKKDQCLRKATKVHIPRKLRKRINVCNNLLKNFKKLKIYKLLDLHCPLPEEIYSITNDTQLPSEELLDRNKSLLQMHHSLHCVFLFVRSVIQNLLPCQSMWGTKENESRFFRNIEDLLSTRLFDKMQYSDLVTNISVKEIPWLPDHESDNALHAFIKWLITEIIFIVLRRLFYVTDHAKYKNRLFFYRHEVWTRIVSNGVSILCRNGIWAPMLEPNACRASFRVRFIPKSAGIRPIMSVVKDNAQSQISTLHPGAVLKIFKCICSKHSYLLGCSTSGLSEIHELWRNYWIHLKRHNIHQLFFVKVDIHRCFETIPADKLLEILRQVLSRSADVDISSVSKVHSKVSDCDVDLYQFFESSLKDVLITLQAKKYRKVQGIPQGWCLSTMLCNIFFGNLESTYFPDLARRNGKAELATMLETKNALLLRYVDDFLFVSHEKGEALAFLKRMHEGFPDYGCYINPSKSLANFHFDGQNINQGNLVSVLPQGLPFPWFGLLFPTTVTHRNARVKRGSSFGGVALDLRKYQTIGNIRDCMTVSRTATIRFSMKKLHRNVKLRTTMICFDPKINSKYRVLRNLFELALLTALQWLGHDLHRHPCNRLSEKPAVALMSIEKLATDCVLPTIRRKLPGQNLLTRNLVSWIFCKAFLIKLTRHSAVYKRLVQMLNAALCQLTPKWMTSPSLVRRKRLLLRVTSTFPEHLKRVTVN